MMNLIAPLRFEAMLAESNPNPAPQPPKPNPNPNPNPGPDPHKAMLAESLQHSLSEMAGDDFVKGMRMKGFELRRFSAGEIAPELLEARAYDLGPTAMAFDFDVRWHSQMVAEVDAITTGVGARVPVSVRNLRFDGPVRLIVTDLTAEAPGYGAVLLSLPTRPEVGTSSPNPNPNPNPNPM